MIVLFDIDGTLLNDAAATRAGAAALHASVGADHELEEFLATWTAALDHHFDRYLRGEIAFVEQRRARIRDALARPLDDPTADAVFDIYARAYEQSWSLYADVAPCLEALAAHRLGVVSNGPAAQQRSKLERTGIADRFEHVIVSEEASASKPDAAIFLLACEAFGTAPSDVVYVGDRYDTDALGARGAGLAGVWLDRAGELAPEHAPPTIATLGALPDLVGALARARFA
jgi:putative hydrolase of the HAD superfamily